MNNLSMLPESRSQFGQERLHFRFFCGYGTGTEVPDSFVNRFNFHARKSPYTVQGTSCRWNTESFVEKAKWHRRKQWADDETGRQSADKKHCESLYRERQDWNRSILRRAKR